MDFTNWEIKLDKAKLDIHKTLQIKNTPIVFPKSPYEVQ